MKVKIFVVEPSFRSKLNLFEGIGNFLFRCQGNGFVYVGCWAPISRLSVSGLIFFADYVNTKPKGLVTI